MSHWGCSEESGQCEVSQRPQNVGMGQAGFRSGQKASTASATAEGKGGQG